MEIADAVSFPGRLYFFKSGEGLRVAVPKTSFFIRLMPVKFHQTNPRIVSLFVICSEGKRLLSDYTEK
jgi:hypothetical protein